MSYIAKRHGVWGAAAQTQTAGTAIALGIPPFRGASGGAPLRYAASLQTGGTYKTNWFNQPFTKVTNAKLTSGSTAHTWYVLRPKNWTYIATAVAKNATTVVMFDNPGTYSANYKYPLPGTATAPGCVADNTPAANDYCMFQLDSGQWHFSLISSLSTLTLTIATAVPNVDGSTAAVGSILFFFGAGADVDPATSLVDPNFQPPVSATTDHYNDAGLVTALHQGDPLMLVNANAAAASTLAALSGAYDSY